MKIIVGLGNPGKEYEGTRHNVGFMFVDAFSLCKEIAPVDGRVDFHLEKKFEAQVAETSINGTKILLVKPQTFMNSSGKAVAKILSYYKEKIENLIVISDDIDLPVGTIRIRDGGSSGGQKGLKSIIDAIGDDQFLRIRIGILESNEKLQQQETINYVLGGVGKRMMPVLENAISAGVEYLAGHLIDNKVIPAHTIVVKP